ncbi:16S rRNA (uracil(1498)-N(3))-methyltransferase [Azospirillum picis]|uniref:Ribosomal RNA small subunit methyltransferase E n=1 Tax=Azospirillum picis TaxID=488438 RepID=A0ABU0MF40_9PROT|nr:16S rRNA (uracil(1498)-N(3))-methyltransferase [Azospirillum picis]MBP2298171.1 16S rRNA (uracil1498-N3)-methyltransferase [Azospirillum picis]MDQ0532009.1 16S rRNA (uracil1498-N3)-methyltransferase [Azospirillum picis]
MADPIKTRLYVDSPLADGQSVGLDHERAHFLRHVLRLDRGDSVAVFNGRDGEWRAAIDGFGKGWCSLTVAEQRRGQDTTPDLWLLFAPLKKGRIDFVAEKATEMGVSRLWPVFTRRTDPNRVNLDRLRANAVEAAEQCERLGVPEMGDPLPLDRVLAGWPAERRLYLCAEAGMARPFAEVLRDAPGASGPAALLVGPEGGFDQSELDELVKLPFVVPVGLGPRILRADTAVVAALACWQSLAGDWTAGGSDRRPPFRAPAHSPPGQPSAD